MANATAAIRGILKRVTASKRPAGVSIQDAEGIMGRYFHSPKEIRKIFHIDDSFLIANAHIGIVPFTREELAWAARFGVLLTLTHPVSMNACLRNFSSAISIAEEVKRGMEGYLRAVPTRLEWRLVMRPHDEDVENRAMHVRPKSLGGERTVIPSFRLLVAASLVDWRLNGILPTPLAGARFTRNAIIESRGIVLRRVIVDGGVVPKAPIRVITGKPHAPFKFATAFLPQSH